MATTDDPLPEASSARPRPTEPSRRERMRVQVVGEIKSAAWAQIRTVGAPALSLRSVAREVGMSSPGLYRYFASRDELLTALIVDAYDDLTSTLRQARDDAGPESVDRLRAVCLAYFDWSDRSRAEWGLIFGTPVPSYEAPQEGPTTQAARRFGLVFLELAAPARPGGADLDPGAFLTAAASVVGPVRAWCRLHGVIALGLHGHLPPVLGPGEVRAMYKAEVEDQLAALGLS